MLGLKLIHCIRILEDKLVVYCHWRRGGLGQQTRLQWWFSLKSSQYMSHSSAMRVRYGVSLVWVQSWFMFCMSYSCAECNIIKPVVTTPSCMPWHVITTPSIICCISIELWIINENKINDLMLIKSIFIYRFACDLHGSAYYITTCPYLGFHKIQLVILMSLITVML